MALTIEVKDMKIGMGCGLVWIAILFAVGCDPITPTVSDPVQDADHSAASVLSPGQSGVKNTLLARKSGSFKYRGRWIREEDVSITLHARKASYFLGENILLDYKIAYKGDGDLGAGFNSNCRVIATDTADRRVAESGIPWHCNGGSGIGISRNEPGTYTVPLMRHCNFDKPGTYRIQVVHSLGWSDARGKYQYPNDIPPDDFRWAETTITLIMPDAQQARQVVEAMRRSPDDFANYNYDTNHLLSDKSWRRSEYPDFVDFTCLRYPIYLPILMELATGTSGDERALAGIAHTPAPEATAALVALLKHPNPGFALRAAGALNDRLPDPSIKRDHRKNPCQDQDADLTQVQGLWDPKLAPDIREYARKILLARSGAMSDRCASFILEAVGTGQDMPAVVAALADLAGKVKKESGDRWLDTFPGTSRHVSLNLVYAGQALVRAGATPPPEPRTQGQIIQYALSLKERADFRPQGWETLCTAWLGHEIPFVREQVLRYVPRPLPEPVKAVLPVLLTDPDDHVLIAALDAVRDGGGPQCRDNLVKLIATTMEEQVLENTPDAAHAAGIARDEYLGMLVDRLEPTLVRYSLYQLFYILNEGRWKHHGPACIALPSKEQIATAQQAWRQFIRENAEAIRRGKRFEPTDPEIVPGMFSAGLDCYLNDKQRKP